MIDITGIDKAELLAALYNNSHQVGLGMLDERGRGFMSRETAQQIIEEHGMYFDYLWGRILKVDISRNELDPRLYDRDLGEGAAERVVSELRS